MPNSLQDVFPRLTAQNHRVTSPRDLNYNCVAWAMGITDRRWDPNSAEGYWPDGVPQDVAVDTFVTLFETLGFETCADSSLEAGHEKIAIYGQADEFRHVARQLESGTWTSKLGDFEDIEHDDLHSLMFSGYGSPLRFLRRTRHQADET